MIRKLPQGQETPVMIHLTRLNKRPLVVNSDLLKFIENTPDTVITLVSGEKIVVLETTDEVIARVVEFRQRLGMKVTAVMSLGTQASHPEVTEPPPMAQDFPDENG